MVSRGSANLLYKVAHSFSRLYSVYMHVSSHLNSFLYFFFHSFFFDLCFLPSPYCAVDSAEYCFFMWYYDFVVLSLVLLMVSSLSE